MSAAQSASRKSPNGGELTPAKSLMMQRFSPDFVEFLADATPALVAGIHVLAYVTKRGCPAQGRARQLEMLVFRHTKSSRGTAVPEVCSLRRARSSRERRREGRVAPLFRSHARQGKRKTTLASNRVSVLTRPSLQTKRHGPERLSSMAPWNGRRPTATSTPVYTLVDISSSVINDPAVPTGSPPPRSREQFGDGVFLRRHRGQPLPRHGHREG
jgi:hypothetical protein